MFLLLSRNIFVDFEVPVSRERRRGRMARPGTDLWSTLRGFISRKTHGCESAVNNPSKGKICRGLQDLFESLASRSSLAFHTGMARSWSLLPFSSSPGNGMEKRWYMPRKEEREEGGSWNLCDSVVRRRYTGGGARDTRR